MRASSLLLFALALFVATSVRADVVTDILPGNDPDAASRLLGSPGLQADLKTRDPENFLRVFAHAAELKDMHDLLFGASNAVQLRKAFFARPECAFCQKPEEMQSWAAARLRLSNPNRLKALSVAYWDWPTLNTSRRTWLDGHGSDEASWAPLTLAARREKLKAWAEEESAAILALNPNTMADVDAMETRTRGVSEGFDANGMISLWDRLSQVRAGLSGMNRARAMLGDSKDPAVRQAYAQALNAPDPGARLSALSRVFDGLDVRGETVLSQAPSRAGQTFDDHSRQMIAGLLTSGFMSETDGTSGGRSFGSSTRSTR